MVSLVEKLVFGGKIMHTIGKIAVCMFVAAMATLSVFANGQADKPRTDGGSTITLKGYMQIDPADPQYAGHNAVMKAFAEKYPDIKLNIEYATGEAFHQKFQAMSASGQMPDIFTCYGGARSAYILEPGLVLDLNKAGYLTDSFKSGFNATTFTAQGSKGEIWMIPPSLAVCHTVYVNKKILKELGLTYPATYKDWVAQIPVIRKAGYYVCSMGNKDAWVVNSWLLSLFVDRLGGPEWFMNAAHGKKGASFTDKPFTDSLALIQQMVKDGLFSPGVNQMSNTEADQEFYQGKSVYLIDAGWRTSGMDSQLSTEMCNNIDMKVFPEIPGEIRHDTSTATTSEGFGISAALKGTPKADAAWKFLSFYAGKEGAAIRAQYGEVPTCSIDTSAIKMGIMQKKFAQFQKDHKMGYVFDSVMNGEGVTILNNDIQAMMLGNGDPQTIAQKYEKWVAQNDTNRE